MELRKKLLDVFTEYELGDRTLRAIPGSLKAIEIGLQKVIEKEFEGKAWYESCNADIFMLLLTSLNAEEVIDGVMEAII